MGKLRGVIQILQQILEKFDKTRKFTTWNGDEITQRVTLVKTQRLNYLFRRKGEPSDRFEHCSPNKPPSFTKEHHSYSCYCTLHKAEPINRERRFLESENAWSTRKKFESKLPRIVYNNRKDDLMNKTSCIEGFLHHFLLQLFHEFLWKWRNGHVSPSPLNNQMDDSHSEKQ